MWFVPASEELEPSSLTGMVKLNQQGSQEIWGGGVGVAPKPRLCNLPFVQMGLQMASSQSRPTRSERRHLPGIPGRGGA